jgi:hypothetical protein
MILRKYHPLLIFTTNFPKINLNIILRAPSPRSKWLLPTCLPTKLMYTYHVSSILNIYDDHIKSRNMSWILILIKIDCYTFIELCRWNTAPYNLDYIILTKLHELYKSWSCSLCNILNSHFISFQVQIFSWALPFQTLKQKNMFDAH